ncbi:endonuclease SmrB [Alteromonas ponticola]|uniref:Ribosome rescue factor SmrB n=1 Tax=Alteromonas aquimaris TaxID=2998417 RepID=A0ABT3P4N5_9ALTE|nr:endonuclease SmrB [Alteromonas aquimaris]MCW8107718.1 endonuclease SmrB [Alteromonas aquimaris]
MLNSSMKELRQLKKQLADERLKTKKANINVEQNDEISFREVVKGVKPLIQDKIPPPKRIKKSAESSKLHQQSADFSEISHRRMAATFSFSDMYQAQLPDEGPMRYCKSDVSTYVLKQLRRGDFSPEMVLDLHGLTKEAAKQELAALIYTARKELIDCVSVMHGKGSGILKNALPHYLIQHPHVKAFHQAPKEYGGQSAILVLIDIDSAKR